MPSSKLNKMPRIYVSAAMRGGSTLVSNILNAHSKVQIIENFHFQRFLYKKNEVLNKKKVEFRIREMGLRLGIRFNIKINEKNVLKEIFKGKLSHKNIYDCLIKEQLKINPSLKIIGEDSALNWRFIEIFCKMYKNAKVIQLIRDPRSIFASWKKITYQKKDYWGCIFNCIDNMNYGKYLSKKLSKKNYMCLRFEDILTDPNLYAKKIAKFINIKFEPNMTKPEKWEKIFKNKYASLGFSSIEKKSVNGFFTNRIDSWKRELSSNEIKIVEYFAKKNLKQFNYELSNKTIKKIDLKNFLKKKIDKSNYLKKNFSTLLKTGHGTDLLSTDPTDPKTWGDGKQNKKKFIESSDGKKYMQEIKKIKKDIYKEI
mgnify:CR=1 FL=1|tara:strand:+ start:22366 stop:23475 length:1110 start_codon:yes stop_codon:yes gene_type:complete